MAFIINGERIGDDAIEEEFDAIKDHYANLGEVVCCDRDEEFRAYANENIINRTLMVQESHKRFGPVTEEQIEERLTTVKAEHGGDSEFYENTGLNRGDDAMIRRRLAAAIAIDRLLGEEIGEESEPTEAELRAYYEANIERYLTEEKVRVSQLFVEPESQEGAREAYRELRKIRQQLREGADFHATAVEHGDRDEDEIDLGFMQQGETMPEIEAIVFSLETGEISPIVATHFGFHLFVVTDREEPSPIPFEQVQGIEEQFRNERREKSIGEFVAKLRAGGTIEEVEEEIEEEPVA